MAEEKKEYALHLDASEYKDKILKGSLPALVGLLGALVFSLSDARADD